MSHGVNCISSWPMFFAFFLRVIPKLERIPDRFFTKEHLIKERS